MGGRAGCLEDVLIIVINILILTLISEILSIQIITSIEEDACIRDASNADDIFLVYEPLLHEEANHMLACEDEHINILIREDGFNLIKRCHATLEEGLGKVKHSVILLPARILQGFIDDRIEESVWCLMPGENNIHIHHTRPRKTY